jgi:hypothetical protein
MSVDRPPSEDVMAAWLCPIVSGQDLDGDCLKQPVAKEASETMTMAKEESKEGLPATDGMSGAKVRTWARPVYPQCGHIFHVLWRAHICSYSGLYISCIMGIIYVRVCTTVHT